MLPEVALTLPVGLSCVYTGQHSPPLVQLLGFGFCFLGFFCL